MDLLNQIAACATIAMGFLGLLLPTKAAGFVGLVPVTNAGRSEFRATFGGLWLPPIAYAIAGLCWFGTAVGRVISILVDQVGDAKNWGGVVFESLFCIALLVGAPIAWLMGAMKLV
ncbi:MAG: DUF4345 family protein [Sphingomonadales bacterium]|nr:DUF4345 family protein [Sphingomonadales bacterium]